MIGIYVHIPFCRRLCPYCDFLRKQIQGTAPDVFVSALCREIGAFDGPDQANTVFFGGGTPSLLAPAGLARVMDALHERFALMEPEVTLEANPDDVTADLAQAWKDAGINRVSLGVQSFDDRVLHYLGRRHNADAARHACEIVRERFGNWSMDLIFGARPVDAWDETLAECVRFAPNHVSTYGLTYESGTPFEQRRHDAVDDGKWIELYRRAEQHLHEFDHYEISNHARTGFLCRHNLIYWRNEPYAGFGPGAYSFLNDARIQNNTDIEGYLNDPLKREEEVSLSPREIRVETLIQHFRLRAGLEKAYYAQRFHRDIRPEFEKPIGALIKLGLLAEDDTHIRPTRLGYEMNNEIGLALVG